MSTVMQNLLRDSKRLNINKAIIIKKIDRYTYKVKDELDRQFNVYSISKRNVGDKVRVKDGQIVGESPKTKTKIVSV